MLPTRKTAAQGRRTADPPHVVWLSAETPNRHGSGGQRRQYHHLLALRAEGVEVSVATLAGPQDDASLAELLPVRRFGPLRARGLLPDPELARFLSDNRFTAAVVAHVESVPHVRRVLARRRIPWLLDLHNVNSRWHEARGERLDASLWRLRERAAIRAAAQTTVCSAEELDALLTVARKARVEVAAHGVDPAEWPAAALAAERDPTVAYFGAWDHGPNREGAEWLAERVWPAVLQRSPQARLVLAGPGQPPPGILSLEGVEYAGRVEDLAGFLGRVRVIAVPILNGIGARMKFGEALASGAAVVSTTAGAEGFAAEGAYARADDPDAFATACARLSADRDQATALGQVGRRLALERFRWSATSAPIVRFASGGAS